MADYLVVGGGLAGCVVASRLKQSNLSLSITIIEAGTDEHANPMVTEPLGVFQLKDSQYQYNYKTTPQKHYDGRQCTNAGGRMLSGSTACNYGAWMRGDAQDYDDWAEIVKDKRWSYAGQLPYFKRTEHHFDASADSEVHGFEGPVHTAPINRSYPLKEPLRCAFERMGIQLNEDGNAGRARGYAAHVECWRSGKRQPAGKAYPLEAVEILTSSPVQRVIVAEENGALIAKGVELVDGRQLMASKEVILCCGAIRSPQILMLSGIGPAAQLEQHNIPLLLNCPEVGRNLWDHPLVPQYYRVRHPEEGLCVGSLAFHTRDPAYNEGLPIDWLVWEPIPAHLLEEALREDGEDKEHNLLRSDRNPAGRIVLYAPVELEHADVEMRVDGSILSCLSVDALPTSRGSITLASASAIDDPLLDPNYFATKTDRAVLRYSMRRTMATFETPEMTTFIECEIPPPGFPILSSTSTDDELDARIRKVATTWYHAAGSCAMGKVVDTDLRVMGVGSLRIVDTSVFPSPIAGALQCPTYALAEQASDIIGQSTRM